MLFSLGQRADASTDWREFTSPEGRKCVTYIFSWPLSNCSSTVGTFVCYLCIMLIALFVFCRYYYNKVTRTSKWRMPDEVKVMLDLNPIWVCSVL